MQLPIGRLRAFFEALQRSRSSSCVRGRLLRTLRWAWGCSVLAAAAMRVGRPSAHRGAEFGRPTPCPKRTSLGQRRQGSQRINAKTKATQHRKGESDPASGAGANPQQSGTARGGGDDFCSQHDRQPHPHAKPSQAKQAVTAASASRGEKHGKHQKPKPTGEARAPDLLLDEINTRLKYLCDVACTTSRSTAKAAPSAAARCSASTSPPPWAPAWSTPCLCSTSPASACTRARHGPHQLRPCAASSLRATPWWWSSTTRR